MQGLRRPAELPRQVGREEGALRSTDPLGPSLFIQEHGHSLCFQNERCVCHALNPLPKHHPRTTQFGHHHRDDEAVVCLQGRAETKIQRR